jgi:hypothetical protein
MNEPAFDVQKPIGNGAASADIHPRLGGVLSSVFGSSNTLVSAAQLTVDTETPAVPSVEVKAAVDVMSAQFLSASFSDQDKRLTPIGEAAKTWGERVAAKILGELIKPRRTGPVQVLSKIANDWRLSNTELAGLLAYSNSQSAAELLDGRISLRNPDREDRVRLLYRIYRVLSSLFPEVPQQQAWLRATNPNLGNKSPLEFMLERRIPGMISVQNLVERLAGR